MVKLMATCFNHLQIEMIRSALQSNTILGFVGFEGLSIFVWSISVDPPDMTEETESRKEVYSVWGIPPEEVGARVKKVMEGLRSEFGGPAFEPHVTVVGAISLTEADALHKFRSACDGLKAYDASVDSVATGTFFYQCVYLLLHPMPEVISLAS